MTKPIIAANKPAIVALEKDKQYFFCTCGRSQKQPYCDGSHQGTEIAPLAFTADEDRKRGLCQCKLSKNFPYCDGSHKALDDDRVGQVAK